MTIEVKEDELASKFWAKVREVAQPYERVAALGLVVVGTAVEAYKEMQELRKKRGPKKRSEK